MSTIAPSQPLEALALANEVRLSRAALKCEIARLPCREGRDTFLLEFGGDQMFPATDSGHAGIGKPGHSEHFSVPRLGRYLVSSALDLAFNGEEEN